MKKCLIDVENEKITVHESEGKGQVVVLIHGNSFSSKSFYNQLEGPLGKDFHLLNLTRISRPARPIIGPRYQRARQLR